MKNIIVLLISYLAAIVLFMPDTIEGIVTYGTIYGLISIYILAKKPQFNIREYKFSSKTFIFIGILIIQGNVFYKQWITSSKIMTIAELLRIPNDIIVLATAIVLIFTAYIAIENTWKWCCKQYAKIKNKWNKCTSKKKEYVLLTSIFCIIPAIINCIPQFMIRAELFEMGIQKYIIGMAIIDIGIIIVYICSNNIKIATIINVIAFGLLATINSYVFMFREIMLNPVDLLSIQTATNVISNYNLFNIPKNLMVSWIILGIILILVIIFIPNFRASKRTKTLATVISVILIMTVGGYVSNLKTYHWKMEGAEINGYFLEFVAELKEIKAKKPEDYNSNNIELLSKKYQREDSDLKKPHIIVVMDESFADLNLINEFSVNKDVMPYISSLKENTIKGNALASVFGGNTANSEYEFLTGNSMAWLPQNSIPYQQFVKEKSYSAVSYLENNYGYKSIAMHPFYSSGWNRPNVYSHFGFDETMFLEDFPQTNILREYVSDKEMFEKMIDVFENNKENPLFMFGVTMQNHGGYEYVGDNFKNTINIDESLSEREKAEQYLTCINETDSAVEMLVEYFKTVDEDVVIVFFGDHLPGLSEEFYTSLNKGDFETLEEQQEKYTVPFFVWANYDIPEKNVKCTSLNYLSSYMYEAANIPLPAYNMFLNDLQKDIPAMNANGYYSNAKDSFIDYEEAEGKEKELLLMYEQLQYNSIFDKENRNSTFFEGNN